MQPYEACNGATLKFPVALILSGIIVALWRQLQNNEWEVLVRTRVLLRHRAVITPVSLLRMLGSYVLARVTGQFFVRLKLFSNGNCRFEFKFNVLCKSIASKIHSIWYELYLKKYLIEEGNPRAIWRMIPSKARAKVFQRMPTMNGVFLFRSTAELTPKARHGTKIYEQGSMQSTS